MKSVLLHGHRDGIAMRADDVARELELMALGYFAVSARDSGLGGIQLPTHIEGWLNKSLPPRDESRRALGGVPVFVRRWEAAATKRPMLNFTPPVRVVRRPPD